MELLQDKLDKMRILPTDDIPKHEFLYEWQNKPCFARGELVALTGKAKSGKTYVCSLLLALADKQQLMGLSRPRDEPYKALWIDTEQSQDSTQEILCDRIGNLIGHQPDGDRIVVYNMRGMNWQDRLGLIEIAITQVRPDLVIFDGIRDVVGDINDYQQAQDVLTQLLLVASLTNSCIVCVLHQNKAVEDKTLRGALGTELQNKSYETYECAKDVDTHLFTMRQIATRKYDIPGKLQFEVNDEGLPVPVSVPAETTASKVDKPKLNPEYIGVDGKLDAPKLFSYILANGKRMGVDQLKTVAMKVGNIYSPKFASDLINEAYNNGILNMLLDPQTKSPIFELKTNEILGF